MRGGYCLIGTEFQFQKMKKVLEMGKYLMPLNCTFLIFSLILFGYFWLCWVFVAGSSLLCRIFSSCGEQGLLCRQGSWAAHCGVFSCCGAKALVERASVVGTCALSRCSARALGAHGLSYSEACGIFQDQG